MASSLRSRAWPTGRWGLQLSAHRIFQTGHRDSARRSLRSDEPTSPQWRREAVRLGPFEQQRLEFSCVASNSGLRPARPALRSPAAPRSPCADPTAHALLRRLHPPCCLGLTQTFSLPRVDDQTLDALARKEAGMALYAEALLLQEPIGTFREFWKVLESAFAAKDAQLIRCLSEYTPAEQLGFTQTELRGLHTLRGRASHAESRYGLDEHESVLAETSSRLARLKCLAEQVILTKKTWGVRTTECERLAPVSAFIDANGGEVLIRPADPTEEGNRRGN